MSIPTVDEEFPAADLIRATGEGTNVAATGFGERFYRRYGRYPTDADLGIIAMRRQFEKAQGRPPTVHLRGMSFWLLCARTWSIARTSF